MERIKTKKVEGDNVYFYNARDKTYYKLCESFPTKNIFNDTIHFIAKGQKCDLEYSHADIVAVESKTNDKACKVIYKYKLIPKGNIINIINNVHCDQLHNNIITKDKLVA